MLSSLADQFRANDTKDWENFFGDLAGLHERTKRYDIEILLVHSVNMPKRGGKLTTTGLRVATAAGERLIWNRDILGKSGIRSGVTNGRAGRLDPIDHNATEKRGIHETTHHETSHLTENALSFLTLGSHI